MHYENYGLSHAEIADLLDVGVSTVHGWKKRNDMPKMAHMALSNPRVRQLEGELAAAKDRIARLDITLIEVMRLLGER